MTPKKKPFAGYVRVSSVAGRTGPSFISPDVQREAIERLARAHGLDVEKPLVQELDVSGGKPIEDRKLGRLATRVEAGELGGVIVWKLSRFSRNLLDGVTVAQRIEGAGGRLLAEDYDSRAPMAKPILGFMLGWAEEEREARKAGWLAAQERALERGATPARTPLGYLRREDGSFEPDPVVAPVVTAAFRARARGASFQECADIFAEAGVAKARSRSGVRQLLSNEAYLGHLVYGDFRREHAHEAIVDGRTWQLAQRAGVAPPRDGSLASQGVLAGLIRCEGCGHLLTVNGSGSPERMASYGCRKRRASGVCPAPASAAVHRVDAVLVPQLDERAGTVDLEEMIAELYEAQEAFLAAGRELDAFSRVSVADLGPELYSRGIAERRETLRAATEAYREAQDAQDRISADDDLGERREVARRLIEGVTLRKAARGRWEPVEERLDVVWR